MKRLKIADRPVAMTVREMRGYFELAVLETTRLDEYFLLDADDPFTGYDDDETHSAWIGFAIGMRCAERIDKFQKVQHGP